MSTRQSRGSRLVAALGSVALGLVGLVGLSTAANAADGNVTDTAGTLNIYKHANPGGELSYGDGTEATAGGKLLGGVPFTLYKVGGVDLVTGNAGWDVVAKVSGDEPVEPKLDNQGNPTKVTISGDEYTLSNAVSKTTVDGTGLAEFSDVHPGLYVVVEGDAENVSPDTYTIVSKAAPFFVVLPIKDQNGAWSYTVNVHPKNTVSTAPTKTAEVKNDNDGVITWTVTQTLPSFDDSNKLTKFELVDDLSKAGATNGTVTSVNVTVNGADSTTSFDASLSEGKLTVTAKEPSSLTSGAKIVVTYTTVGTSGSFENKVTSYVNDSLVGTDTESSSLGKITLKKTDAKTQAALAGAVFKVCVDKPDVEETKDCDSVGTITTGVDGTGSLDKLKIQNYVLFETTAPAGYTFDADKSYKASPTTEATEVEVDATNTKASVPTLPLTGANGQLLMTVGGVALVLLASGVVLVSRKKHSEE